MNNNMRLSVLAVFCVVWLLLAPSAGAVPLSAPTLVASVAGGQESLHVGDAMQLQLDVQHADDLFGLQFVLHYDPSKLQPIGELVNGKMVYDVSYASSFHAASELQVDEQQGTIAVALTRSQLPGTGGPQTLPIAAIRFQTLAGGDTTVSLTHIKIVDSVPQEVQGAETYSLPLYIGTTPPSGISLDAGELWLDLGERRSRTLAVAVLPPAASGYEIIWTSDDPAVATVEDGVVTAVGPGETVVQAAISGFDLVAAATVKVGSIVTLATDADEHPNVSGVMVHAFGGPNGKQMRAAVTNADGEAIFTDLTAGHWSFRTHEGGPSAAVPEVLQAAVSTVDVSQFSPAPSTELRVVNARHPSAASGELYGIRDVVSLAARLAERATDFNQDGVVDRHDVAYLLQMIGNETYVRELTS